MRIKRVKKMIAAIGIFATVGISSVLAQESYTQYCNARYGFCVEYPVTFGMDPAPDNNDGRRLFDREGFSMSIYGSYNALDHTLKEEMDEEKNGFDTVTYKKISKNWYVLSGYQGEDIVYLKTFLSKEAFYHLSIRYPAKNKAAYDEIVSTVARSFSPGE